MPGITIQEEPLGVGGRRLGAEKQMSTPSYRTRPRRSSPICQLASAFAETLPGVELPLRADQLRRRVRQAMEVPHSRG